LEETLRKMYELMSTNEILNDLSDDKRQLVKLMLLNRVFGTNYSIQELNALGFAVEEAWNLHMKLREDLNKRFHLLSNKKLILKTLNYLRLHNSLNRRIKTDIIKNLIEVYNSSLSLDLLDKKLINLFKIMRKKLLEIIHTNKDETVRNLSSAILRNIEDYFINWDSDNYYEYRGYKYPSYEQLTSNISKEEKLKFYKKAKLREVIDSIRSEKDLPDWFLSKDKPTDYSKSISERLAEDIVRDMVISGVDKSPDMRDIYSATKEEFDKVITKFIDKGEKEIVENREEEKNEVDSLIDQLHLLLKKERFKDKVY